MKCIKCGLELDANANFCSNCGTKLNGQLSFYNWLAFISYSHKDSEITKYIETELKKFKLPLIIEQNNPALKKLRFDQLFRDENNFGNGALEDQIQFGLQNSKFLIAICSPNYAKANNEGINWCDEEIKQFLSYHNNDDSLIIPVIIDGVPHSENECFPPSLLNLKSADGKSKEALGIAGTSIKKFIENGEEKPQLSINEKQAKDEIFDAIKARLLGLNYGAYKNYAHQEKYFLDYADVNGIPVGIGELTENAWTNTKHYKFIYREDLLDEVRYENGNSAVIIHTDSEEKDKIVDSVFFYDEKGVLLKIEERDIHGNVSRVVEFKKNFCVMNFTDAEEDSKNMDANFSLSALDDGIIKHKSEIKSLRLIRDEKGYIVNKSYHKYHNEKYPVCDSAGIYGIEYENDADGRVLRFWYLNAAGNHVSANNGVAGRIYEYDKKGNRIKDSFVDIQGKPTINEKGYSIIQYTYDDYGNPVKAEYFDTQNKPVINKDGFHCYYIDFDEYGNKIKVSYHGLHNEKVFSKEGYASYICIYDDKGNILKQSYLGLNNEPVLGPDGYTSLVQKYDSKNYIIQQDNFGLSDEPVLSKKDGVATLKQIFDEKGNLIEGSFFGADGKPICRKSGDAKMCFKRDKNGNPLEVSAYDVDGKPVLTKQNYSTIQITYDDFGNPVERRYYGTEGELRLCKEGYAIDRSEYDSRGRQLQISYYGTEGRPVLYENSYSIVHKAYDDQGNLTEISYYGINEEPVLNKDGIHSIKSKYDKAGHRIESTNFGLNDESILCNSGYFKECGKYDEYGKLTEITYYGLQGELVIEKNSGFSKNVLKYERGNIVENIQYGPDGNMMINPNFGFAKLINVYDNFDRIIQNKYFGCNDEPILTTNGHIRCYAYDNRGNITEKFYLGTKGERITGKEGYSKICIKYDKNDQEIEKLFFDENDNLCTDYARITFTYNERKLITEIAHYKADGTFALVDKYFKYLKEYNEEGHEIKNIFYLEGGTILETSFDNSGLMTENKTTFASGNSVFKRFNKIGKEIEISTYDIQNNLRPDKYGYSNYYYEYLADDKTKKTSRRCEPNGNYCIAVYDQSGNELELAYYNKDGTLRVGQYSFAKRVSQYDNHGNILRTSYYGDDGKKMLFRNYSCGVSKYDEKNNCIETAFFGLNDEPVLNMTNRHKWIAKYDEKGNKIEEASYGISGEPVLHKDGFFKWKKIYDKNGNCTSTIYYDLDNNEIRCE